MKPTLVKTWKVRTIVRGVVLTLNGQEYELGASAHPIAFDVERAAVGWNTSAVFRATFDSHPDRETDPGSALEDAREAATKCVPPGISGSFDDETLTFSCGGGETS